MASLPDDVLMQILLHLPPRSIVRFRAVCKAWHAATRLPSFARAHAATRPAVVAKVSLQPFVVKFELFGGRWRREGPFARDLWTTRSVFSCRVIGSWDGVLCLFQPFRNIVLWNPVTYAVATVPVPAGHDDGRIIGGYAHPVTGRFHLLHSTNDVILPDHHQQSLLLLAPTAFQILRVGDNIWRQVPWEKQQIFMKKSDGPVAVDGTLHWLVQSAATAEVTIVSFDMAREQFRFTEGPKKRPGLALQTTRTVLSDGKLAILTLANNTTTSVMEMWVLDDYSDQRRTWQLKEKIRMVRLDQDLSLRFTYPTANVEVVEDGDHGKEICIRLENQIDAYNVRDKAWRRVNVKKDACVLMHRESVLPPEVSFGEGQVLRPQMDNFFGHLCYCL